MRCENGFEDVMMPKTRLEFSKNNYNKKIIFEQIGKELCILKLNTKIIILVVTYYKCCNNNISVVY